MDGFYNVVFVGSEDATNVFLRFSYMSDEFLPTWGWDDEDDPEAMSYGDAVVIDGVGVSVAEIMMRAGYKSPFSLYPEGVD